MKKIFIVFSLLVGLAACNKVEKFKIEGSISNAEGQVLYLEHQALASVETMDSVKLKKDGTYLFKSKRPAYPDFYRLRINNKIITFSVDSTETIAINADYAKFTTDYTIEGSTSSEYIKQLRLSVIKIQDKVNALQKQNDLSEKERTDRATEIESDIETHKELARGIIITNPSSPAAYFALYQQLNNRYIFSPYIDKDLMYWRTVATSWNVYMPDYVRTKNLYNLIIDILKKEKEAQQREVQQAALEELMQYAKGYIDITLPDVAGEEHSLSELEGKVILIDFSTHQAAESIGYTLDLRDLYNKYHSKGFEIYQVSLDQNQILWEISVENLPWVSVRDENGYYASLYNVTKLPTTFLMDREGNIKNRDLPFDELDKQIGKLVK